MKILFIKSLLTSLYQREGINPSFPHSGGFAEAKVKRGKGRFSNECLFAHEMSSRDSKQVGMIKRRDFIRTFILGGMLLLFSKRVGAEKRNKDNLKEAMFWKRID
jgi:hypothetical protein